MRRSEPVIGAAAGGVLIAAVAALAAWSYAERPQLNGTPRQWYRTSAPQVLVPVEHSGNLGDLRARVDGQDAAAKLRVDGRRAWCSSSTTCTDGTHRVRVQAQSRAASSATASTRPSRFTSTRAARRSRSTQAPSGWQSASELSGRVEPGSTLALSYSGKRVVMHPRSGAFALDPKLPDGRTTVKLIASDRAGNRSVVTRTVAVDRTAPRVHIDRVAGRARQRAPDPARIDRRRLAGGAAGAARRRLGRAARSRRQRAARRATRSRAASRSRCSTSRRASTRSRSRRPTAPATRPRPAAGPFTVDSTEKLRTSTCSRWARAAPTSCSSSAGSRPSAPTTGPSRASTTRAPRPP